ncbi:CatB-related O-acetyltransferase [Spirosoma aerolatum]|uniref:CatB-related O-acetyltransferase n=1 Tax=Spirosoma aerolatum TaxID=1211326 RepID=UPI0009ADFB63|nr:CatB-related O-acetyltransferase [Spirosoma aerolatum]
MKTILKRFVRYVYLNYKYPKAQIAFSATVSLDSVLANGVKILPGSMVGDCKIDRHTYVGNNCQFSRTQIGAFTSIGPEVICGLGSHPVDFVSTYPGFYSSESSGANWFGSVHAFADKPTVQIGSDVWIGARAIILGGVKIGHGAIIAAGAVVTKDVPAYSIVGGVPGKVIRYRFEPTLLNKLLDSNWWNMPDDKLRTLAKYVAEPSVFVEKLAESHGY